MWDLLSTTDLQLTVLGSGDWEYEAFFKELAAAFPEKVGLRLGFVPDLARKIYAGSDLFLMPSKSEPCGLSQMIASRYGTVPITRETGGLADSIKGYWVDKGEVKGNGFTFANYSSAELAERTDAAIKLYGNEVRRRALVRKIMSTDFSWGVSAKRYLQLYQNL
jgi:starch synthase